MSTHRTGARAGSADQFDTGSAPVKGNGAMNQPNATLAALIGSRICHDLISPIGAIHNGLELLEMANAHETPEVGLIGESVSNASARIRFFRVAFGAASDQMLARTEVVSILDDLYRNSRLNVIWEPEAPQPRAAVRLTFLSILCFENALPYGGSITVSRQGDTWKVSGGGDRLVIDPVLWSFLRDQGNTDPGQETQIQPAQVQFALLPMVAERDRLTLQVSQSQNIATISFG
jgi:histidine phosphotransferase ChpT